MKIKITPLHRLTLLLVPFVGLWVYVTVTARPVHATVPGKNGQIAYTQGDPNAAGFTAKVWIANPDGSHQQQVTLGNPVEFFSQAIWSPDGTKLLISHTARPDNTGQCCLFQPATVNPDGSDFNQLDPPVDDTPQAGGGMNCGAWSGSLDQPLDQTRLLCGIFPGTFSILASYGSGASQLATNPYAASGGFDFPSDISPDGKRFVFQRFKPAKGPSSTPVPDAQVALFVENIDGSGLRQITPYLLSDNPSASWSPDGLKIVTNMSNGAGGGANRLFIVDPNGGGVTPISLQLGTQKYSVFAPAWSPDGKRIIFCVFINGGEGIYTANPNGSDVEQVTFTTDFSNLFDEPNWGAHPVQ